LGGFRRVFRKGRLSAKSGDCNETTPESTKDEIRRRNLIITYFQVGGGAILRPPDLLVIPSRSPRLGCASIHIRASHMDQILSAEFPARIRYLKLKIQRRENV
jgi:hypothetical protein